MDNKKRILIVEDEVTLAMIVGDALEEEGHQVITAENGLQGIDCYYKHHPDIIIADIMLPEIDGFEMVRRIRKDDKSVPVLFLSARSSTDDIVFGFELGANDYVRKPFSLRELVARVKALLCTNDQKNKKTEFYEIGLYTFYPDIQTLLIAGEKEKLSFKESEILKRLCENENHPIYSKDILLAVWGDDSFYNARSLHVFITKLRHKLEQDMRIKILNVRGIGYKLIYEAFM
ncbi:response regulator transcription factor [Parabacteroides sp. AM08-6]|uniref:response regulator transcription factor n=1 Tax=Parabacteroides sp. AM08-6 TaxID=2292053 RepID=UPI000EFE42F4|nr:response regulator transcription factor [Parabacteroides sp. AM08-6]RHJ81551.1 DNA-binding response regulator [Parabacteroides sp. AM08-6]